MKTSLITRLVILILLTVLCSFAALGWVFHHATSDVFVSSQNEEIVGRAAEQVDTHLTDRFETAYDSGGWSAVNEQLKRFVAEDIDGERLRIFVIDGHDRVVVTNDLRLLAASVAKTGEQQFLLAGASGANEDFEIVVDGGIQLSDKSGQSIGHLFALPIAIEEEAGNKFAFQVWQSAAFSFLVILGVAVAATVLLLRQLLRPMNDLTAAAEELSAGGIPVPITPQGGAEFRSLIDAFNSATLAIARTENIRRQLVSDIAHELRTPLTNIRSILEAAGSGLLKDESETRDGLLLEARSLQRLIDDFQQLTLTDAGQLRMNLFEVPLACVIESCLTSMAEANSVHLDLDVPKELKVIADEDRLKQIFCNLLENSIRYQTESLVINVRARARSHQVVIEFRDNGPGIESEDQPFIFDRFYRGDKSRNRETGGSGLGLAITKAVLEAMGGSIRYTPVSDGASFEIILPNAHTQ